MVIAIYLLIAAGVVYYVFRPLFQGGGTVDDVSRRETRRRQLIEDREMLLESIRELDFDHRMGKVEEADYGEARGRYEAQAIDVLKAIDRTNGKQGQADVEKQVEAEIASLRKSRKSGSDDSVKCSDCGAVLSSDARFCAQCGTEVPRA